MRSATTGAAPREGQHVGIAIDTDHGTISADHLGQMNAFLPLPLPRSNTVSPDSTQRVGSLQPSSPLQTGSRQPLGIERHRGAKTCLLNAAAP